MEIVIDIEYNSKNGFMLIGCYSKKGYKYFLEIEKAIKYICKFKYVYVYNLEYDFQFFLDWYFENTSVYLHYNQSGLSYVDIYYKAKTTLDRKGISLTKVTVRQIWKDLAYHCNTRPVKQIAKMIGMEKTSIDFFKMSKRNIKTVIKYNKNDCKIEWEILKRLKRIYSQYGCKVVKATIGSNAFEIYKNKFYGKTYFKIPKDVLNDWRRSYKGGYCKAFKKGKFKGLFYLIDVNSMYSFIMLDKYPNPKSFKRVIKLPKEYNKFFIAVTKNGAWTSFEKEDIKGRVKYYFIFEKYFYPFRCYVEFFHKLKKQAQKNGEEFKRIIYKTLCNALYGKFAQLSRREIITNSKNIKKYLKNYRKYNIEEMSEGIFRVWYYGEYPYWTNFVWSVYTTAKARFILKKAIQKMKKMKGKVYYCDTDSIIFSGNVEKIKDWFSDTEIGKWKIEVIAKKIEITGKKVYQCGEKLRCKGVSGLDNQKRFIKKGIAYYDRFVKIKEKIRKGSRAGLVIRCKKTNRKNK